MGGIALALEAALSGMSALAGETSASVVTWLLAIVFLWSGSVKLRSPAMAALAIADFGVLRKPRRVHGLAVGAAELALSAGLILVPGVAVFAAAALLWCFTILIARSLASGADFACFCFGDSGDALSRFTLARTGTLAVLATTTSLAAPLVRDWTTQESWLAAIAGGGAVAITALFPPIQRLIRMNRDQYAALTEATV